MTNQVEDPAPVEFASGESMTLRPTGATAKDVEPGKAPSKVNVRVRFMLLHSYFGSMLTAHF